jgi:hypothetical protein
MDSYQADAYPKIVVRIEGPAYKDVREFGQRETLAQLHVEVDWAVVWPLYLDVVKRATAGVPAVELTTEDAETIQPDFTQKQ